MKLQNIRVENFKGIVEADFIPTDFGCLVGENNAGKSTVLQAIVYALNRPTQMPLSMFYDVTNPVLFVLTFAGITEAHLARLAEEHRQRIASILVDDTLVLSVRYRPNEKVELTASRLIPSDARYRSDAIDGVFAGKRGAALWEALELHYPEFATAPRPDITSIAAFKAHVTSLIFALPRDNFHMAEGALPSGISSSISALLPEAIYIPAVKSLTDDLKTTQSTSFGRLLALLLEDMAPDLAIVTESLGTLNSLFNRVVENGAEIDRRHPKVRSLEALVESFLGQNFPRAKVELQVPPPDLKSILSTAQIFIDDGAKDLIDNKGDGIKRSLTFALLQAYVQQIAARNEVVQAIGNIAQRPLIFLFEEPELYLHPKSQRVLFNTLAQLSKLHQVVVTTHSPMFFAPGITAAFVRVGKMQAHPKPVGCLFPVNFSLDQVRAETFRLARYENADAAFFSQRVILFEGESDDAYCKHIAKLLNSDWDFEENNVALVRVCGKGNFAKFRDFFSAFGIDVKIVADLDALFDGYQHLGSSEVVNDLRARILQTIDARIAEVGTSFEPAARQIKDKISGDSWKGRYNTAKDTLREIQRSKVVSEEQLSLLDKLFTWEQAIGRVRVCRDDPVARSALVPLLDALRREGICVLARGAIEDYYPANAPSSGAKPERALTAAGLVADTAAAVALSEPLQPGRPSELEQIFEDLFRGL